MTARTHYDVLAVARHATPAEVRRAHRDLARLLHPDHLDSLPLQPSDRALAEVRIREVNEAWRVLGDPQARATYDRTLGPVAETWVPPWEEAPERREPKRPTPVYAAPSRHDGHRARPTESPSRPFRWMPVLVWTTVVCVGIVALLVLLGDRTSSGTPSTTLPSGTCVSISNGPSTRIVPCTGPNDGRVVDFVSDASTCPPGSTVRRLSAGDAELACLVADPES